MSQSTENSAHPTPGYAVALDWLYSTQTFGVKFGLEATERLLNLLDAWPGNPAPTIFHVAGTNGKGSVCAFLDQLCREQGRKTGLFTSPHLVDFSERFRVNGEPIPPAEATRLLIQIREAVSTWIVHPTFFEIVTALALRWFAEQGVDVMILETGMGGRLDSTNAITANVSIITRIDLDHQKWLGETVEDIAREKAGIIKRGIPVICVPQIPLAMEVLEETARELGSELTVISEPYLAAPVSLAGSHQPLHAAVALAALELGGMPISPAAAAKALGEAKLDGRFQRLTMTGAPARSPAETRYILDGAHNPAAAVRLALTWREEFGDEPPLVICGILGDKDAAAILNPLSEFAELIVPCPIHNPRALTADGLSLIIGRYASGKLAPEALWKGAKDFRSVLAQLEAAYPADQPAPRKILVTGSLFLIGEALAHLTGGAMPRESAQ